jgi:microsomal dipeptidase-like Zn-dependent dipeptidase
MLHRIGVRYMTLTHNGGPGWAEAAAALDGSFIEEGSKEGGEEREGLTAFGCEVMAGNTGAVPAQRLGVSAGSEPAVSALA